MADPRTKFVSADGARAEREELWPDLLAGRSFCALYEGSREWRELIMLAPARLIPPGRLGVWFCIGPADANELVEVNLDCPGGAESRRLCLLELDGSAPAFLTGKCYRFRTYPRQAALLVLIRDAHSKGRGLGGRYNLGALRHGYRG